jgi:hypothetical protein
MGQTQTRHASFDVCEGQEMFNAVENSNSTEDIIETDACGELLFPAAYPKKAKVS